jgi:hypothetical protein
MARVVKMQILVIVLVIVVGALLVLDVMIRRRAEDALVATVEAKVPSTHGTTAAIGSFPFIGRLVVQRDIPTVTVRATDAIAGSLPLHDVAVTVRDVKVDLRAAIGGNLRISSIGGGSLSARILQEDLSGRVAGLRVVLLQGRADVSGPNGVKGELVTSKPGVVTLRLAGRTVDEVSVPDKGILPCVPTITVVEAALDLACSFTKVPDSLLAAAQSR